MSDAPTPDSDDQLPPLPDYGPTDGEHGTDADPETTDANDPDSIDRADEQDPAAGAQG